MLKLHKCVSCPALIRLNQKRCLPCAGDRIRELHDAREKRVRAQKKLLK